MQENLQKQQIQNLDDITNVQIPSGFKSSKKRILLFLGIGLIISIGLFYSGYLFSQKRQSPKYNSKTPVRETLKPMSTSPSILNTKAKLAYVRDGHIWMSDIDGENEEKVTSEVRYYSNPKWSTTGKYLAFSGVADEWVGKQLPDAPVPYNTYYYNMKTKEIKKLLEGVSSPYIYWLPDGESFVYFDFNNSNDISLKRDSILSLGNTKTLLTVNGYLGKPVITADGSRIAFYYLPGNKTNETIIVIINTDGSGRKDIPIKNLPLRSQNVESLGGIAWGKTNDELYIAILYFQSNPNYAYDSQKIGTIHLLNLHDLSGMRNILDESQQRDWAYQKISYKQGKILAFRINYGGKTQIVGYSRKEWVIISEPSYSVVNLLTVDFEKNYLEAFDPVWSPTGREIIADIIDYSQSNTDRDIENQPNVNLWSIPVNGGDKNVLVKRASQPTVGIVSD